MSATRRHQGTKIIRVRYERGTSGFLFASSDDIDGLVVSAKTEDELDALVPEAITDLYAACAMKVIVNWVDDEQSDDVRLAAALPAEVARQKLKAIAA